MLNIAERDSDRSNRNFLIRPGFDADSVISRMVCEHNLRKTMQSNGSRTVNRLRLLNTRGLLFWIRARDSHGFLHRVPNVGESMTPTLVVAAREVCGRAWHPGEPFYRSPGRISSYLRSSRRQRLTFRLTSLAPGSAEVTNASAIPSSTSSLMSEKKNESHIAVFR